MVRLLLVASALAGAVLLAWLPGQAAPRSQIIPQGLPPPTVAAYLPLVLRRLPTSTATTVPPKQGPTSVPPAATRDPAACAAEYPTVCIPPPDLNCADIPYRNFPVLPPDRHRFDQDNDGVGCEGTNGVLEDVAPE